MLKTCSIIIKGKVQGVFYRQGTKEKAQKLGITGTVSNKEDGSVNIIATGSAEKLSELIKWCHTGPPKAIVTNITVVEMTTIMFRDFTIIRS